AVERDEHGVCAVRRKPCRRAGEALGEQVDDAITVTPELATPVTETVLGRPHVICRRRGHLLRVPRAAPIGRGEDHYGRRRIAVLMRRVASKVVGADVYTAKERARRGVISPDLLLVLKRGLTLFAADDDRRFPVALTQN